MESVKIYVFRDEHDSIVAMNSSYILGDDENYEVYKEVTEDDPDFELAKYAQSQEYVRKMMGSYLLDENLRPNFHGNFIKWSEEEKDKFNIDFFKQQKRQELSNICNETIINGIDVDLSIGTKHFSLTIEDQINLFGKQSQLLAGAEQLEYHADGEECTYFSKEDMTKIIEAAMSYVSYHTTYCNSLYLWINNVKTKSELDTITYGADIPEEYQSEVLKTYIKNLGEK